MSYNCIYLYSVYLRILNLLDLINSSLETGMIPQHLKTSIYTNTKSSQYM